VILKFVISCDLVQHVGPGVNDGIAVEKIHGGHEAVLKLLFGGNTDEPQACGPGQRHCIHG
jgi:hypothetical protein